MKTAHLHVPDMHCASCVAFLERMPSRVAGVEAAQVDFPRKRLTVRFDEKTTDLADVRTWLAAAGFPAQEPRNDVPSPAGVDRLLLARLAVAGFAFGNTMLLARPTVHAVTVHAAKTVWLHDDGSDRFAVII